MVKIKSNKKLQSIFVLLFMLSAVLTNSFIFNISTSAANFEELKESSVYVGGMPFGIKLYSDGVTVVGIGDVESDKGRVSPGKDAGLMENDVITSVNGKSISSVAEFISEIENSGGNSILLKCRRKDSELDININPVKSVEDNEFRTGLWIRDITAGIGTVTFVFPESGVFGGLGHGITTNDGELVAMRGGAVCNVNISGVRRGVPGTPGELNGHFSSEDIGILSANTTCGIFGVVNNSKFFSSKDEMISLGERNEVKEGSAYIICTLDNRGPRKYDVTLSNIDYDSTGNKNFQIKVSDEELKKLTGGIIQGMSGSPIIQDDKLIGAVTHVLISDPTSGYGIFIDNMFSSMEK